MSKKIFRTLLLFCLAVAIGNIICLNLFKLDDYIHSDIVAEMNYVQAVRESGSILPYYWIHSQELFTSRLALISVPIYALTNNLVVSYQISVIVGAVLSLLAFAYFLKSLKISTDIILVALVCATFMATPVTDGGTFVIGSTTWAYFMNPYALFVIVFFITMGFYVKLHREVETIKYRGLKVVLLSCISFYMGFGGPRLLLILYIPMFVVGMYFFISRFIKRGTVCCYNVCDLFMMALTISNVLGYALSKIVIHKITIFNTEESFNLFPLEQIIDNIKDASIALFNSLGIYGGVPALSLRGANLLLNAMFFLAAILFAAYVIKTDKNVIHMGMMLISSVSLGLVFVYEICFAHAQTTRYFFIIPFLEIAIISLGIEKCLAHNQRAQCAAMAISCFVAFISFSAIYLPLYKVSGRVAEKAVANYLKDENYEMVYGSYWTSGILKGLANGNFEAGHFKEGFQPFLWLTDARLYSEQVVDKKTAIVLKDDEEEKILLSGDETSDTLAGFEKKFEIENYNIYQTNGNRWLVNVLDE